MGECVGAAAAGQRCVLGSPRLWQNAFKLASRDDRGLSTAATRSAAEPAIAFDVQEASSSLRGFSTRFET